MQYEIRHNHGELEAKARDGDAAAQYLIGRMCETGGELPRDTSAAFEWFRKAAEQGFADAQFEVGVRYQRVGHTAMEGSKDEARIEAYKWFKLAAGQGLKKAANHRDLCALRMSREEVAEGNRRAATFAAQSEGAP